MNREDINKHESKFVREPMSTEVLKLALVALEDLGMKHFESTGEVIFKETFAAIKELLAQPEQNPVALEAVYETIIHWDEGGGKRSRRELARRIVSLYHTSPNCKPLTDEAIATVYWGATGQSLRPQDNLLAHNFARAIEAAHGIKV